MNLYRCNTFFTQITKMTRLRGGRSEDRIPNGAGEFFFSDTSRQVRRSTKPPVYNAPLVFPGGQSSRGVNLTTHLHLLSRLRKRGVIPPTPHPPPHPTPICYYGVVRNDLAFCFNLNYSSYVDRKCV